MPHHSSAILGVLSGAADPVPRPGHGGGRSPRSASGLALLFAPPFDHSALDPGYIKGYPPGIRENGGQYTHAAAWSVIAYALLGQGEQAAALYSLLNPINRTLTRAAIHRYKVEPYVIAADIYSVAPHVGRGGWTWYTGSAGDVSGRTGSIGISGSPTGCIWRHAYPATGALRSTTLVNALSDRVENPQRVTGGVAVLELDGVRCRLAPAISVADDGGTHRVRVVLGKPPEP
jgi:cyclic beta-1,2-glucan synthetase